VTFHEAAVSARARLVDAGIQPETAARDADLLARHALKWDMATWLARRPEPATPEFIREFDSLLARRQTREPVAYIRGIQEFWGREYAVTPAVLIPRPETELLIETAGEYLRTHPAASVVDVGTGSGCIAVTLALEFPNATVRATDISTEALQVARANATRWHAPVNFINKSLLTDVPRPIDLIVSNPPYVAKRDAPALSREVRDYEPAVALYGGTDGWDTIRALLAMAPEALRANGLLLMELGYGQSESLAAEISAAGRLHLDSIKSDLQGIPRVACVRTI
jgi:release factor glutamine methyltransferase